MGCDEQLESTREIDLDVSGWVLVCDNLFLAKKRWVLNVVKRIYGWIYLMPCLTRLYFPRNNKNRSFLVVLLEFHLTLPVHIMGTCRPPCTHDVGFSHPEPFLPKLSLPTFWAKQEGFGDAVVLGCNSEGGVFWLTKHGSFSGGLLKSPIRWRCQRWWCWRESPRWRSFWRWFWSQGLLLKMKMIWWKSRKFQTMYEHIMTRRGRASQKPNYTYNAGNLLIFWGWTKSNCHLQWSTYQLMPFEQKSG